MKDIKDIFVNTLSSFLLMLASTAYAANGAEAPRLECVSKNEAIHSFLQDQIGEKFDKPQTNEAKAQIHNILDTSLNHDLLAKIQTAFLDCPEEIHYLIDNENVRFKFPVHFQNMAENEYVAINRTYDSSDLITEWLSDLWTAVMVTTSSTYKPGDIISTNQIDHNLPNNEEDPAYPKWEHSTLLNIILGSNNDRQGVRVYKKWVQPNPPTYTWLPVTPKYFKMPGLYFHSSNNVNKREFNAVRDFLISKNSPHLLSYTMQYAPAESYGDMFGIREIKITTDFISRMHPILFHGDIRQVQKFIQELKKDIQQECPNYDTDKCKKWNHVNFYIVSPLDSNTQKPTYQHDTPSNAYGKTNNVQETTVNKVQILYGPIRVAD